MRQVRVVQWWLALAFISIGLVGMPEEASAQELGRATSITASGVPYFVYAEAGEPTIQVFVIGAGTGIYEVGTSVRLDELLTLASLNPGVTSTRAKQEVTIRLYRTLPSGERQLILEKRIEELLQMNPSTYPDLQEGDFVNVEIQTDPRFTWREVLQIITSISSLILLGERLSRIL